MFKRHILRDNIGRDLILGTFESRTVRVTADAPQRLITMVQKTASGVQYSDRPFDTVEGAAWCVEHFRRLKEDTRV